MSKLSLIYTGVLLCLCLPFYVFGIGTSPNAKAPIQSIFELPAEDIVQLDRKAIAKKVGRKLKLKERFTLRAVKRKLRKNPDLQPMQAFQMAQRNFMMILGLSIGLLSLFLSIYFSTIGGFISLLFSLLSLQRQKLTDIKSIDKGLVIAVILIAAIAIIGGGIFDTAWLWYFR